MRRQRDTIAILPAAISSYVVLLILLPFLFYGQSGYSQDGEFIKNANGLIYPDKTISQLRYIVDSLNLKFKVCELNPTYRAKPQAIGHYIFITGRQAKSALVDIEQNMPFEDFVKKYRPNEIEKNLLVIKSSYENYEGKPTLSFSSVPLGDAEYYEFEFEENLSRFEKPMQGKWVFDNVTSYESVKEGLSAIYITQEFTQKPLPPKYARMVQYSDCLVDTTAQVFLKDARRSGILEDTKQPEKVTKFLNYVDRITKKPDYENLTFQQYKTNYQYWQTTRFRILEPVVQTDTFKTLLSQAIEEAQENGGSTGELEEYALKYISPEIALKLKRGRIVTGNCSMDRSPRIHAFDIAQLAAETVNWEIFLRAHLDIMNDNFSRMTDGSYAWAGRKTYIRELEVLDINVPDLLFGITLRIGNPAANHYFGDIGRLGRALSESGQNADFENQMLSAIGDESLDNYNRILMYYLFRNYNNYLENKDKQTDNIRKLNAQVKTLPAYLASNAFVKD